MTGIIAANQTQIANASYLWIYALLGIFALVGIGVTVSKFFKQQGANAERLENRLRSIERQLKPNGLDTEQVGDVVKRTENAVEKLTSKLDEHIGAEHEARQQIWRKVNSLERKDRP